AIKIHISLFVGGISTLMGMRNPERANSLFKMALLGVVA
ncbi:MAG: hypothetical protein ACI9S8_003024, partial [Chlamydiales bacterium]